HDRPPASRDVAAGRADPADADRVAAARDAARARGPHPDAPAALRRGVGEGVRASAAVPARARHQPAPQDRARAGEPAAHRHRAGRRLPLRARSTVTRALRWLVWGSMLVLTTVVLHGVRDQIEQSHITLVLLLVVLGGSMEGGRPLGFTLACASFAVIDYFFQPPYDSLTVHKTQDWVVLTAFLVTAGVTTELLSRSRQEAALARRR